MLTEDDRIIGGTGLLILDPPLDVPAARSKRRQRGVPPEVADLATRGLALHIDTARTSHRGIRDFGLRQPRRPFLVARGEVKRRHGRVIVHRGPTGQINR